MIIKDIEGAKRALEAVAQYRKSVEEEAGFKWCSLCDKRFPATSDYFSMSNDKVGKVCKTCINEKADLRRLENREQWKLLLYRRKLDFCSWCGYNRCSSALELHHLDPLDKEMNIGSLRFQRPTKKMIKELDKCICLCANCHRELHHRLRLGLPEPQTPTGEE